MTRLIEWFTKNSVAANLLMGLLVIGGLLMAFNMKQEVFPEFQLEAVQVTVAYPGASPQEVEAGILLAIEDAVTGIDGIKRMTATANESSGTVALELQNGADVDEAVADVKNAVDRIQTFPEEALQPTISAIAMRSRVVSVVLAGDQTLPDMQRLADFVKDEIVAHPDVSVAEISGLPPQEVAIEIPTATLQAYGLTLDDIGAQVAATSLERPGGTLQTRGGDLLVRVSDRRTDETDFADIPIVAGTGGATVRLGDIATITQGFEESDIGAWLNGERGVRLDVFRVGDETPSEVAAGTRAILESIEADLPDTLAVDIISDDSQVLTARLELLLKNALTGLILVLIVLALFLDLRVAVWVAMGIPIAFLGAFVVMPVLGVSINMISLFALLVVLGLVVDDAIVVGEQVAYELEKGEAPVAASVAGTKRMVCPIVVAVLTTVFAFAPMFGLPGVFGKIFSIFPLVVIAVLAFSLVESFFILPSHLAHGTSSGLWTITEPIRSRFSSGLQAFIARLYTPTMNVVLNHRIATIAAAVAVLLGTVGLVGGGWVPISFFPDIGGETVVASARLPAGTPTERLYEVRQILEDSARQAVADSGDADALDTVYASIGGANGNEVNVELILNPSTMDLDSATFESLWMEAMPPLVGLEALKVTSVAGPSAGAAVEVELSHADPAVVAVAARELQASLATFTDLTDLDNTLSPGAEQLDMRLSPAGEALGLTSDRVSRQVRSAYQGSEALREQIGRNERTVRVRLPEAERASEAAVLALPIRVAGGGFVELGDVVEIHRSAAPAEISREDGRRQVSVLANLAPGVASSSDVTEALRKEVLPELRHKHPGLAADLGGQTEEMADSMGVLIPGFAMALLAIYALLAATFRSYVQPAVVMTAIPFGIVGAVLGHLFLGYSLSMVSMFGIIALAGVVVNDSLVLVDAANENLKAGMAPREAILAAGQRRFRPILLTSLTTFLGLAPMILETSIQAAFLIPMAISLGFGILFATVIVLVLVPAFFMVVEDIRGWLNAGREHTEPSTPISAPHAGAIHAK
ncbi:MAG: efflux RND transporter permease subunit [Myxococcota bacterium]